MGNNNNNNSSAPHEQQQCAAWTTTAVLTGEYEVIRANMMALITSNGEYDSPCVLHEQQQHCAA